MLHCVYACVSVCVFAHAYWLKSVTTGYRVVHGHCFKKHLSPDFRKLPCPCLQGSVEIENLRLCITLLALLDEVWYLFQADTSRVQETCHGNRLPELT
jgi:hypothetical protein